MARVKSTEKRTALIEAAVHEIAASGLGASTAKIAKSAGLAEGTLFTYFATKQELLNELYLFLKTEAYERLNADFPHESDLKQQTRYVWASFLDWGIQFPEKYKVSVQLNLSELVTSETRERTASQRHTLDTVFAALGNRPALATLPKGFAAATMGAMQEATMVFVARHPGQRKKIIDRAFELFWRAIE